LLFRDIAGSPMRHLFIATSLGRRATNKGELPHSLQKNGRAQTDRDETPSNRALKQVLEHGYLLNVLLSHAA
jgi:hypothetical protein